MHGALWIEPGWVLHPAPTLSQPAQALGLSMAQLLHAQTCRLAMHLRLGWASPALQNGLVGVYLADNQLAGPAFPDAWVAPNTSLRLWHLSLANNRGLSGTLPAYLPWVDLKLM